MDPVKPSKPSEQPRSQPLAVNLAQIVESHSSQLARLNSELTTAFASIQGELNEMRNTARGTTSAISGLSDQLSTMSKTVFESISRLTPESLVSDDNVVEAPPVDPSLPGVVREPNLPNPNVFEGNLSLCRGFVSQCELIFRHQISRYSSPEARVAFIVSLLSGRALQWAIAALENEPQLSSDYSRFVSEFRLVFDHPAEGPDAAARLHSISQGSRSVADYAVEFRILATESRWGQEALLSAFRRGLNDQVKDLILRDRPTSLSELISLALLMDERLRERRQERSRRSSPSSPPKHVRPNPLPRRFENPARPSSSSASSSDVEPMQIGRSRLTPEERERRFNNRLCLYCGKDGHIIRECPLLPKTNAH